MSIDHYFPSYDYLCRFEEKNIHVYAYHRRSPLPTMNNPSE
mgnify:FL=1